VGISAGSKWIWKHIHPNLFCISSNQRHNTNPYILLNHNIPQVFVFDSRSGVVLLWHHEWTAHPYTHALNQNSLSSAWNESEYDTIIAHFFSAYNGFDGTKSLISTAHSPSRVSLVHQRKIGINHSRNLATSHPLSQTLPKIFHYAWSIALWWRSSYMENNFEMGSPVWTSRIQVKRAMSSKAWPTLSPLDGIYGNYWAGRMEYPK